MRLIKIELKHMTTKAHKSEGGKSELKCSKRFKLFGRQVLMLLNFGLQVCTLKFRVSIKE